MKYILSDLVNITKIQVLLEKFYRISRVSSVILDLEGKEIAVCGWQNAYNNYLTRFDIPIRINSEKVATLFYGQFFLEKQRADVLQELIEKYGTNENEYLRGLNTIPIISNENIIPIQDLFEEISQIIEYLGEKELDIINAKNKLRDMCEENECNRNEIEKSKKSIQFKFEEAEEAVVTEKIKSEFLITISHELRTPLNVVLAAIQMMEVVMESEFKETDKEKIKKYITIMKKNSYRLVRIVNNLLDISEVEANNEEIVLKNYNMVEVIENITLSVAEYAKEKGLSLVFDTDVEEKIMCCDSDKIEKIMLNLLSNAIKFTKTGGEIFVEFIDKGDNVIISVKDTGIGIPEDKKQFVFENFAQVDKSLSRNQEGSGIGLSIVNALVKLHKGSVILNSVYGEGSEFIVTLPAKVIEEPASKYKGTIRIEPHNGIEKVHIELSDIYF